jgi:hypothetical protein
MQITDIKMRWYKSDEEVKFRLQIMYFFKREDGLEYETNWQDIPYVIDGVWNVGQPEGAK